MIARNYEFTAMALTAESMPRDRIVCGVSSQDVRRKLQDKGRDLTLDPVIQLCRSFETSA